MSQPLVRRHAAPAVKFARNLCTAPPTKPPRHPSLASSARRMSSSVPKPRATKTAAVRKPANAARLLVLAVPAIGLGALGYHLYGTVLQYSQPWVVQTAQQRRLVTLFVPTPTALWRPQTRSSRWVSSGRRQGQIWTPSFTKLQTQHPSSCATPLW